MIVVLNTVVLVIISVIVESGVILRTCVWLLLMIETCLCFCHHLLLSNKGMCVVDNMLQYSSVRCMYQIIADFTNLRCLYLGSGICKYQNFAFWNRLSHLQI